MAQVYPPRQINSDGSVNVYCKVCGEFVCRMMFRGFTSVVCESCSTGRVSPIKQERQEMMDPLSQYHKKNDVAVLYTEENSDNPKVQERFGLIGFMFRALGFSKKVTAPPTVSETVAKEKRRKPLFAEQDADDDTGR